MKTILTSVVFFILLSVTTRAQRPIEISEDNLNFGKSTMPGFSVIIPEAGYDATMKNWVKLLQSGTKSKVVNENGEISIFGARIKDISDTPVNVYSKLAPGDSAVNLKVAYELRKDEFAGNTEREKVRTHLMSFAKDQYIAVVKDQLSTEKNKLNNLEKNLSSLEKGQKKMERSNRDSYTTISTENGRLDALNNELASLSAELASRDNPSENTGMGGRAYSDNDPKRIKEINKQIKKTGREIKSSEKKISRAEKEIDTNKRQIPDNIEEQNDARMRVSQQEAVVNRIEDKLDRIKNFK